MQILYTTDSILLEGQAREVLDPWYIGQFDLEVRAILEKADDRLNNPGVRWHHVRPSVTWSLIKGRLHLYEVETIGRIDPPIFLRHFNGVLVCPEPDDQGQCDYLNKTFNKHFRIEHGVVTGWKMVDRRLSENADPLTAGPSGSKNSAWGANAPVGITRFVAHYGPAQRAHFSPKNGELWVATTGNRVYAMELETGQSKQVIETQGPWHKQIVFNPDGTLMALATKSDHVGVLDVQRSELLYEFPTYFSATNLQFSADSCRLAWIDTDNFSADADPHPRHVSRNVLLVCDLATGERRVLRSHGSGVGAYAFSDDGCRIATVAENHSRPQISEPGDRDLRVWSAETGELLTRKPYDYGRPCAVRYVHDSATIAVVKDDGFLLHFDVSENGPARSVRLLEPLGSTWDHLRLGCGEFSADSRFIVHGGRDRLVRLSDAETGELLQVLTGHAESIELVAMSVDNQRVLSADRHCWKLWNVATGRELFDVDRLDGFCSSKLTFSRDLTRVALTETDGTITLWNT